MCVCVCELHIVFDMFCVHVRHTSWRMTGLKCLFTLLKRERERERESSVPIFDPPSSWLSKQSGRECYTVCVFRIADSQLIASVCGG